MLPDPFWVTHALDLMPSVKSMAVWKEGRERLLLRSSQSLSPEMATAARIELW